MTKYLTPAEYSARYKVKTGTLAQWRCRGTGPKFIKIGKLVRYPDQDENRQEAV